MLGETRTIQVELRTADAANDGTPWPKSGPGQHQANAQVDIGQGELWIWGGATRACQTTPPGDSLVISIWDSDEVLLRVTETRSGWRQVSKPEVRGEVRIVPAFGMDGELNLPLAKDGRVVGMISLNVSKSSAGGRNDEDEYSEALVSQVSPIFHPDADGSSKRQARLDQTPGEFQAEVISSQKLPIEAVKLSTEAINKTQLPSGASPDKLADKTRKQSADFFADSRVRNKTKSSTHSSQHTRQQNAQPFPSPSSSSYADLEPAILPHPDEGTNNQANLNPRPGWGPGGMSPGAPASQANLHPGSGWGPSGMLGGATHNQANANPGSGWGPSGMLAGATDNQANLSPGSGWGPSGMLGGASAKSPAPAPSMSSAPLGSPPPTSAAQKSSTPQPIGPPQGWGPGSMFHENTSGTGSAPLAPSPQGMPESRLSQSQTPSSISSDHVAPHAPLARQFKSSTSTRGSGTSGPQTPITPSGPAPSGPALGPSAMTAATEEGRKSTAPELPRENSV